MRVGIECCQSCQSRSLGLSLLTTIIALLLFPCLLLISCQLLPPCLLHADLLSSLNGAPQDPPTSLHTGVSSLQGSISSLNPLEVCQNVFSNIDSDEQLKILTKLLSYTFHHRGVTISLPDDFLHLTCEALKNLKRNGRSNLVYALVQGLGTLRVDGSDTLLPQKRMPIGMIEYVLNFFTASSIQKVCLLHIFISL